jgi:hypothetical protein
MIPTREKRLRKPVAATFNCPGLNLFACIAFKMLQAVNIPNQSAYQFRTAKITGKRLDNTLRNRLRRIFHWFLFLSCPFESSYGPAMFGIIYKCRYTCFQPVVLLRQLLLKTSILTKPAAMLRKQCPFVFNAFYGLLILRLIIILLKQRLLNAILPGPCSQPFKQWKQ